jgi:O-antigen ligase
MKVSLPLITVPSQVQGAANGGAATFLNALGVQTTRSNLPLASGVNGSGAISAAGFAAAAILALRVRQPSRLITVPAAVLCLYATLQSDAHAALVISAGVVALFLVLPRARRFSGLAVVAALGPAIALTSVGLVSSLGLGVLGRAGGDVGTIDGRLAIWQAASNTIANSNVYHLLVGYGADGQVTSGASVYYAYLFQGVTADPLLNTVHDLPLQTMLDSGILGLVVLVLLAITVFTALSGVAAKAASPPAQALMAVVIVFLLNGTTEALPSYLFAESIATVLLVAGASIALEPRALMEPGRAATRARLGPLLAPSRVR